MDREAILIPTIRRAWLRQAAYEQRRRHRARDSEGDADRMRREHETMRLPAVRIIRCASSCCASSCCASSAPVLYVEDRDNRRLHARLPAHTRPLALALAPAPAPSSQLPLPGAAPKDKSSIVN